MAKTYNLMVVSFDGEKKIETVNGDVNYCWEHSNDMGSKWYFYPFHFVVSEKTVIDTPNELSIFKGKRIKTLLKVFKATYKRLVNEDRVVDCQEFSCEMLNNS